MNVPDSLSCWTVPFKWGCLIQPQFCRLRCAMTRGHPSSGVVWQLRRTLPEWRQQKESIVTTFIETGYMLLDIRRYAGFPGERSARKTDCQHSTGLSFRGLGWKNPRVRVAPRRATLFAAARRLPPTAGFGSICGLQPSGVILCRDKIMHPGGQREWMQRANG